MALGKTCLHHPSVLCWVGVDTERGCLLLVRPYKILGAFMAAQLAYYNTECLAQETFHGNLVL